MKRNTAKLYRIALLAGLMAGTSRADTLFTISGLNSRNDFTGTIGATFTVGTSDLLLTALGVQDFGDDGLTQSHEVAIWGAGATALTTVTVTNADPLFNHFRYAGTSYTLLAGQTYFIGAE